MQIPRFLVRLAVSTVQRVRRAIWFVTRPEVRGVHAVALTPAGRVVLVRLTYAPGWRLPGGGRKAREEPVAAVLRELREEIGMRAHGTVRHALDSADRHDFRNDQSSIFLVEDVEYQPRQTLEVEEVREFDPEALPPDIAEWTARIIAEMASSRG